MKTVMSAPTTVTILGSGTCVPSLERSACAAIVKTERSTILLDAGPGTMHRMLEAGFSIFELDYLCLSHFHPDHSSELVPILFSNKYTGSIRRVKPLTIIGGKGLNTFFQDLKAAFGHWIELSPELFHLIELDTQSADAFIGPDFALTSTPVEHQRESIAMRISDAANKTVVYSGDTDYCAGLIDLAGGVEVFICEAAFPDAKKFKGHLTPSLAGRIAAEAAVKHLVLTHLYPECEQTDITAQCRKTYSGPLTIAKDLMEIPVA
jgi:ribonuclease BN (tRNA processing enzyme)